MIPAYDEEERYSCEMAGALASLFRWVAVGLAIGWVLASVIKGAE